MRVKRAAFAATDTAVALKEAGHMHEAPLAILATNTARGGLRRLRLHALRARPSLQLGWLAPKNSRPI